jgi:histidinol-phosphate/aromatic aminotransferase/cobyric acid decarboxylase-like protein
VIPAPGEHGGDGAQLARALGLDPEDVLDLSQSLNPCAPDVTHLAMKHLSSLRRYPDRSDATHALAERLCTDPARVLLTNGGSEAIHLVAGAIGGTVASEPEFSLHPRGDGPRWASNPNNPTGLLAGPDATADVWDEAFYPLATGRWTRADEWSIVVGSLTKVFACPGLRIGYVVADDMDRFRHRQPEWPLNGLAASLLPELLELTELERWRDEISLLRCQLADVLTRHGIGVERSDAPWLLACDGGLRARLAPHGIAVRDCTSFGLPAHTRIAVPDADGLDRLDRALLASVPSRGSC